jgi:DNA primase
LDPDEIVARDKEEWQKIIENAKPIVTHVMETLAAGQNLSDPKVKNQIAAQVVPLIEDLPNPLERDTYRQALARMLRVDERLLSGGQAQGPRARRPRGAAKSQVPERRTESAEVSVKVAASSNKRVEESVIGLLFHKPELLYRLDRSLQEYGLAALDAQDFKYTDHQLLFGLIRNAVEQDKTEHHEFFLEAMPETLQTLSREVLTRTEAFQHADEKLLEEMLRYVKRMRDESANEMIVQYEFLLRDAYDQGDKDAAFLYQQEVIKLTQLTGVLDKVERRLAQKRLA